MNSEKANKNSRGYKKTIALMPNEENIRETVRKSIEVYCSAEQGRLLTYWEFLRVQLGLIRKRWWLFQLLLLLLLWTVLPLVQAGPILQRIFGAAASVFTILIIPELWKNRTYQAMEIEAVSYYSLRQIYAARMLLFGIVDIALLTLFCGLTAITMHILFSQLLVQFLFPMTVTAAICFGILCSKYSFRETTAIMLCLAWSAIWLMVLLNEAIYTAVTIPLWLAFMGIAVAFLVFTIYRALHACGNYWEVNANELGIR